MRRLQLGRAAPTLRTFAGASKELDHRDAPLGRSSAWVRGRAITPDMVASARAGEDGWRFVAADEDYADEDLMVIRGALGGALRLPPASSEQPPPPSSPPQQQQQQQHPPQPPHTTAHLPAFLRLLTHDTMASLQRRNKRGVQFNNGWRPGRSPELPPSCIIPFDWLEQQGKVSASAAEMRRYAASLDAAVARLLAGPLWEMQRRILPADAFALLARNGQGQWSCPVVGADGADGGLAEGVVRDDGGDGLDEGGDEGGEPAAGQGWAQAGTAGLPVAIDRHGYSKYTISTNIATKLHRDLDNSPGLRTPYITLHHTATEVEEERQGAREREVAGGDGQGVRACGGVWGGELCIPEKRVCVESGHGTAIFGDFGNFLHGNGPIHHTASPCSMRSGGNEGGNEGGGEGKDGGVCTEEGAGAWKRTTVVFYNSNKLAASPCVAGSGRTVS